MDRSLTLVRIKDYKTSATDKWDRFVLPEVTPGSSLTIGRELDCDLRIEMIDVSRRHARFEFSIGEWYVTDLESTNGLFVNGKRLDPLTPHPLKIDDKLSFGPYSRSKLVYKLVSTNRLYSKRKLSLPQECDDQLVTKRQCKEWKDLFDLELSCSICHELFVSPVNLNCAHTFCESCIEQWKRSSNQRREDSDDTDEDEEETHYCPICRQQIVSQNRVLTLDNVIEFILKNWTPSMLEQRRQLVNERSRKSVSA